MRIPFGLLMAATAAAGCAGAPRDATPAVPLEVPHFAAGDARVQTAGFVRLTRQVHREVAGARYTLMAFAVGDTLTLGAMVRGPFRGVVEWTFGGDELAARLQSGLGGRETAVTINGRAYPLPAERGAFRDFTWVNIDVPLDVDGGVERRVRLCFTSDEGRVVAVPAEGAYALALRPAPSG